VPAIIVLRCGGKMLMKHRGAKNGVKMGAWLVAEEYFGNRKKVTWPRIQMRL